MGSDQAEELTGKQRVKNASQARPGNQNHLIHGGEAAERDLRAGRPLRGSALDALQSVRKEYVEAGLLSMLEERALRITAVSDLFFNLIIGAAEAADRERLERYIARYGWLQNSSIRALLAVREALKNQEPEPLDLSMYRDEGSGSDA